MHNESDGNDFRDWMRRVAGAAMCHCADENGLYHGREGALRLARECGPAIPCFHKYGEKNIGATYGAICVIAYNLKPPIDADEWLNALREGMRRARES